MTFGAAGRKHNHVISGVLVKNMMTRAAQGRVAVRKHRSKKVQSVPMPEALARFFRPIGGA